MFVICFQLSVFMQKIITLLKNVTLLLANQEANCYHNAVWSCANFLEQANSILSLLHLFYFYLSVSKRDLISVQVIDQNCKAMTPYFFRVLVYYQIKMALCYE